MKKKTLVRAASAVVCGCLIGTSVPPNMGAVEVQAQETADSEWELVSSILDSYPGVYTEDTKLGSAWNTGYSPDGPLMGNGTVYAFMAGDQKTQNLYISHSNMWQDNGKIQEYTTFGGITIQPYEGDNLALNKEVTVSSYIVDGQNEWDGTCMVDGNIKTKWCSTPADNGGVSDYYWAVVDLGEELDISRWVVRHAQEGGEISAYNTRDFKLQYYEGDATPDGTVDEDWKDADAVTENTSSVTDRNLTNPIHTRYVRLLVTKATQDNNNAVRIPELELYAEPGATQEDAQEFKYVQDMKNAEVTAQSKNGFTTVSWLSAKENILVTEIANVTETNLPLEVTAWTANANTEASVDGNKMIATKAGVSEPNEEWAFGDGTWQGWTVNLAMASQVIGDVEVSTKNVDDHTNSSTFVLAPGQKVTVVSAVEGGKEENGENSHEQAIAKASEKLDTRLTQDALDASKEKHREYWKDYWLKSYIDIQDEAVERMYYGMLYQLGCSTSVSSENNGGTAAGLFPWTASDHPAWGGDYTTNTDFQRQIHPLVTANRTDGIENYLNIIEQFWPDAMRRSESVQDLNWVIEGTGRPEFTEGIEGGALVPTHIGPWGAATERNYNSNDYWKCPSDATAVLMPVIKEWKYTLDEELLERLYPLMKSVAVFWEEYVTLEDGKYVVYGATHENVGGRNAILDVDACKYMLKNTILAANELGADQDKVEIWQNIVDNMSPVPTFIYNGKETICDIEGRTQSNPGHTFNGNPVTIQSVYYYDSIGMSAPDEEKEKYINYLNVENGKGSHRRLISATRLGYDINEIMDQLKSASINPSPSDWDGLRGNNTVGDIGRAANTAIVQDSLIQSNEGFINIFANWFDDQETSFRRLRTENAFLVDADMNEFGQVTYANIHSDKGRDCAVLNPWQDEGVGMEVYKDGEKVDAEITATNSLGDVYTFQTEAGADYELRPAGELTGIIDIDTVETDLFIKDTLQLEARTNVEDTLVWESSDENIATVENGLVIPKNLGDVTITAYLESDPEVFDSCLVHVINDERISSSEFSAVADSEENSGKDGPASYAVDDNEETFWHSGYTNGKVKPDIPNNQNNSITIDLGSTYTVGRVDYVPRQDSLNGLITKYEIWYSAEADGDNFTKIGEGSWAADKTTKTAEFDPVSCRRIRIRAMETNPNGSNKDEFITAAEFYIYQKAEFENTSKKTLEYFLNKAKGYVEDGSVDNCVESVQKLFAEAIAEGDAVMADENATREEVTNATVKLMRAIHALDMIAGDKTDLEMAVELGDSIDLSKYVEAGQAEFTEALAKAKEVLSDGDAFQEDIDSAWNALVDAISNLRLKADKSILEDLINEAEGIDTSLYTEESVAVFTAAFQKAGEVLADETLSEDDQAKVDEAVNELSAAIDGLVAKDSGAGDGGNAGGDNTGDGSENNGTVSGGESNNSSTGNSQKAAKTGDTCMPAALIIGAGASALLALFAGAALLRRKRR